MTGNVLHGLKIAKQHGSTTLIENPMTHPRFWAAEVLRECRTFGIDPRDCDTVLPLSLIKRAEREYQMCDKIIVLSSAARRTFEKEGHCNVEVVWPGIDSEFFRPASGRFRDDIFRVCYAGRIELGKGVLYLLEAWKKLNLANAELVLVGELRPELDSAVRRYSLSNIRYTGFLSREKLIEEYHASSLFAFPSLHEGFGLVMLEAMAAGLPVVGTRSSGAPDCISEGKEGFLAEPRDVNTLADVILWGYENRGELKQMGQAARARIEREFTLQHYNARVIELYRRVASA